MDPKLHGSTRIITEIPLLYSLQTTTLGTLQQQELKRPHHLFFSTLQFLSRRISWRRRRRNSRRRRRRRPGLHCRRGWVEGGREWAGPGQWAGGPGPEGRRWRRDCRGGGRSCGRAGAGGDSVFETFRRARDERGKRERKRRKPSEAKRGGIEKGENL